MNTHCNSAAAYLLHVLSVGGVADDAVSIVAAERSGSLTVKGEASLSHTDATEVLPIHPTVTPDNGIGLLKERQHNTTDIFT